MPKSEIYIKKVLALLVCTMLPVFFSELVPVYYLIALSFLSFGLLIAAITKEKPKELFNHTRTEKYFDKGGLRDLLRIFTSLFGFIFDIIVWHLWGVYQLFVLFIDLLYLIKSILFWISHAIIWFLKLLVPFWVIAYQLFIYYIIKWPWWIYQYSYNNIKLAYNKNSIRISLKGTFIAVLIIFCCLYVQILLNLQGGMLIVGLILSLAPLSWIFAEISTLRAKNLLHEEYQNVKIQFQNGSGTVLAILFYMIAFLVLLFAQAIISALGHVGSSGIILLGIVININFLLSIAIIFLTILCLMGAFILPSYRLYHVFSEVSLRNTLQLFTFSIKKLLHLAFSFIPSSIFGVFVITIPGIVIGLALLLTLTLKNTVADYHIEKLKIEQALEAGKIHAYEIGLKVKSIQRIKDFPQDLPQEMSHRGNLKNELDLYKEDKNSVEKEFMSQKGKINDQLKKIENKIQSTESSFAINQTRLSALNRLKKDLENKRIIYIREKQFELDKLQIDINYLSRKYKQLPLVFFLSGLFGVLIISLVASFYFSYLGHTLYSVYKFKNDPTASYWKICTRKFHDNDQRQPLLSTSLNILIIGTLIIWLFFPQWNLFSKILQLFI